MPTMDEVVERRMKDAISSIKANADIQLEAFKQGIDAEIEARRHCKELFEQVSVEKLLNLCAMVSHKLPPMKYSGADMRIKIIDNMGRYHNIDMAVSLTEGKTYRFIAILREETPDEPK